MARARTWTCKQCGARHPGTKQVCSQPIEGDRETLCAGRRPPRRVPKHQLVLDLMPYDDWVKRYGVVINGVLTARCNICGRPPVNRALHRDHDHRTGKPRGLLCVRCNRALPSWITVEWLRKAIEYLLREQTEKEPT